MPRYSSEEVRLLSDIALQIQAEARATADVNCRKGLLEAAGIFGQIIEMMKREFKVAQVPNQKGPAVY